MKSDEIVVQIVKTARAVEKFNVTVDLAFRRRIRLKVYAGARARERERASLFFEVAEKR